VTTNSTTDPVADPTSSQSAGPAAEPAAELAERLLGSAIVTMETLSIQLGVALGLYRALGEGPADPRRLAERAGIHPRYAREWLEQQAVAGILRVTGQGPGTAGHADEAAGGGDDVDPYQRRFDLPAGWREVLTDEDSPYFLGTLPGFAASFAGLLPQLAAAYRSGGGVPYDAYGELTRHGIAGLNRPMFRGQVAEWLAALPDLAQRLAAGPARVLDLGCGTGSSSFAIAQVYPQAQVHGVDLDEASVAEAREQAQQAGLAGRVSFAQGDAGSLAGPERYDLVCVFEALHDMADPVAALRAARGMLAPGGAILIGDERVAERFAAPGDEVERLNYGFSVLHCLPATRAEGTAVEAGTVLRPDTVREYAERAGCTSTVLPIAHDLWRFYRVDPV
jgi:SAM-dependent methyltransferase